MYFSVLYDTEYKTWSYSQKIFLSNTCYVIVQYAYMLTILDYLKLTTSVERLCQILVPFVFYEII